MKKLFAIAGLLFSMYARADTLMTYEVAVFPADGSPAKNLLWGQAPFELGVGHTSSRTSFTRTISPVQKADGGLATPAANEEAGYQFMVRPMSVDPKSKKVIVDIWLEHIVPGEPDMVMTRGRKIQQETVTAKSVGGEITTTMRAGYSYQTLPGESLLIGQGANGDKYFFALTFKDF